MSDKKCDLKDHGKEFDRIASNFETKEQQKLIGQLYGHDSYLRDTVRRYINATIADREQSFKRMQEVLAFLAYVRAKFSTQIRCVVDAARDKRKLDKLNAESVMKVQKYLTSTLQDFNCTPLELFAQGRTEEIPGLSGPGVLETNAGGEVRT